MLIREATSQISDLEALLTLYKDLHEKDAPELAETDGGTI
jgi:hypothetical protein